MSAPDVATCEMCGTPAGEPHPFRHRFQVADQDVVLEEPKPQATSSPTPQKVEVTGPEGMMIMLLRVLSQKGVLNGDDLARILTGDDPRARADSASDHGDSGAQASG
jgi:hypothetical protein